MSETACYYWGREKAEACLAMLFLKEGREEEARRYYEESLKISEKIKNHLQDSFCRK